MIDYHCHLLPGFDDGAATLAEALAMARILAAAGISVVHCTPHCIRGVYRHTPAQVVAAVAALQAELDRHSIPLHLRPGMEYYLDEFFSAQLADPLPLGETRLLLVESPSQGDPQRLYENLQLILSKGLIPLFAHPERCRLLDEVESGGNLWGRLRQATGWGSVPPSAEAPSLLDRIMAAGVLLQGNLGAFVGYYGSGVRQRALALGAAGRYHCFGSDGHGPAALEGFLAAGLAATQSYRQS